MTITFWLLLCFGVALLFAMLITPAVIRGAGSLKLFDSPDGDRRHHEVAVPRVGGVGVYLAAAIASCAIFARTSPLFVSNGAAGDSQILFLTGAFLGSAIVFLTGLVDDVRGLTPSAKFAAQVLAALVAWYFGARFETVALGYGEGVHLGVLAFPLLVVWLVGVTNAFNFIDGLNGLATGLGVVAFGTIMIASLALGNFLVLVPTVAIAGALIGFLRFNFPKASIFLGDSGSMSIGFLLALLSLKAAQNGSGAVLVVIPLLALSVPLMDATLAILRRWLRHVPISGADARHIHHRLLAMGVSPSRAVVILWTLASALAGFGLLMSLTKPYVASSIAILGVVGVVVMLIYGTNFLAYHELMVATEVIMSAPSRARRVISDQILAVDLIAILDQAKSVDEVATLLSDAASQFGFLGMELIGQNVTAERVADRILPANWGWRLDYPIRMERDDVENMHILSIFCSATSGPRPYGAERIARVLGPALEQWFKDLAARTTEQPQAVGVARKRVRRRVRLI